MGSLFGGEKSEKPKLLGDPWAAGAREDIFGAAKGGALSRLGQAGTPYPGQLSAGLTGYQTTALGGLEQYLGGTPMGQQPLYRLGQEELTKTLQGDEYDPYQGEYYKAYRANMMRELQEAKDRLAGRTSARDQFFGGGRISEESELEQTAMGDLQQMLGQLYETERTRKLGAVPLAQSFLGFGEESQRAKIGFGLEAGDYPRQIEQAGLDREYQEYLRQLSDLGIPLDVAMGLSTYKPQYYQPTYGPSGISQMSGPLSSLGQVLGSTGGGQTTGGGGQTAGAGQADGKQGFLGDWGTGSQGGDIQLAMTIASMFSDKLLKENIRPIENALEKVKQLDGKTYNFTFKNSQIKDAGVIAQDVEKILPEAVGQRNGYKTVNYEAIIALLINAVKELSAKVEPSLN